MHHCQRTFLSLSLVATKNQKVVEDEIPSRHECLSLGFGCPQQTQPGDARDFVQRTRRTILVASQFLGNQC